MAALFPYPARVRFVNADGTLTAEAFYLVKELVLRSGGAEGGDSMVFAEFDPDQPLMAMELQPEARAFLADMLMQQAAEQPPMADMVFQAPSAAAPIRAVTLAASPAAVVARDPGTLAIKGGTLSALAFARNGVAIPLDMAALVPVEAGDTITITYSVAPTVHFIPR